MYHYKLNRIEELSQIIESINLNLDWILSVSALAAQEVAIKARLAELDVEFSEGEDFQNLASKLESAYKEQGTSLPLILLSIARSYRHVRAKLLHEGHKYPLSEEEAKGVLDNTRALINELFFKPRLFDMTDVNALYVMTEEEITNLVKTMASDQVTKAMQRVIDKISMASNWAESQRSRGLYDFIRCVLKERDDERIRLFEMFLSSFFPTTRVYDPYPIYSITIDVVKIVSIRNWIIENNHVNKFIYELLTSTSFNTAGITAEIISGFVPDLSAEQLNRIIEGAITNDQIHMSYRARPTLLLIIEFCSGKVNDYKLRRLQQLIDY